MATVQSPKPAPSARSTNPGRFESFVETQLARARHRIRLLDLGAGALGFAILTMGYALLMVLGDRWLDLPSLVRQLSFVVYLLVAGGYLTFAVVRPLLQRINPYYAARRLEATLPEAKNSVVNWLDLHDDEIAPAFRQAISQRAATDLAEADLDQAVSTRHTAWLGGITAGCFVALFILFLLGPRQFLSLLHRAFAPFVEASIATRTHLEIEQPEGGDATVAVGRAVSFTVLVGGRVPDSNGPQALRLLYRYGPADPYEERILERGESNRWYTTLLASEVRNGFWYKAAGGDAETPEYRVQVRSTPLLTNFDIQYHFRPYLHWADRITHDPNIEALRGTQVALVAHTNRQVRNGSLVLQGGKLIPGERVADDPQALRFSFVLEEDSKYQISFTSTDNEQNADPMPYSIRVLADQPPAAELNPPSGEQVPANGVLPVEGSATDDFGVTALKLHLKLEAAAELAPQIYREGKSFQGNDGRCPVMLEYKDLVDLGKLKVKPGQVLEYWLEAIDNCDYPGPNSGFSKHFRVTIAPPADPKKQEQQKKQQEREQKQHEKQQDEKLAKQQQQRQQQQNQQPNEDNAQPPQANQKQQPQNQQPNPAQNQQQQQNQGGAGKEQNKQENQGGQQAANQGDQGGQPNEQKLKEQAQKLQDAIEKQQKENQAKQGEGAPKDGRPEANPKPEEGKGAKPNEPKPNDQGQNQQPPNPGNKVENGNDQAKPGDGNREGGRKDPNQAGESSKDGQPKESQKSGDPEKQSQPSNKGQASKADPNKDGTNSTKGENQQGQPEKKDGSKPGKQEKPQPGKGKNDEAQDNAKPSGEPKQGEGQPKGTEKKDSTGTAAKEGAQKPNEQGRNDQTKKDQTGAEKSGEPMKGSQGNAGKENASQQNEKPSNQKPGEKPDGTAKEGQKQEPKAGGQQNTGKEPGKEQADGAKPDQHPMGEKPDKQPGQKQNAGGEKSDHGGNSGKNSDPVGSQEKSGKGANAEKKSDEGNKPDQAGKPKEGAGSSDKKPGDANPDSKTGEKKSGEGNENQSQAGKPESEPKPNQANGKGEPKPGAESGKNDPMKGGEQPGAKEGGDKNPNGSKDSNASKDPKQPDAKKPGDQEKPSATESGKPSQTGSSDQKPSPDAKGSDSAGKPATGGEKTPGEKTDAGQAGEKKGAETSKEKDGGQSRSEQGPKGTPQDGSDGKNQAGKPGEQANSDSATKPGKQPGESKEPGQKQDSSGKQSAGGKPSKEKSENDESKQNQAGKGEQGAGGGGAAGQTGKDISKQPGGTSEGAPPSTDKVEEPSKPLADPGPTELQLDSIKKRVNADVLKKANMTQEEFDRFMKAYQELLKNKAATPNERETLASPQRNQGTLPNQGPRAVQPANLDRINNLNRLGDAVPPREFRQHYQEFTRKLSEMQRAAEKK